MSHREPYKVTAIDDRGETRSWTRSSWQGIRGLQKSVERDRYKEGFHEVKLWIFGVDGTWRECAEEDARNM